MFTVIPSIPVAHGRVVGFGPQPIPRNPLAVAWSWIAAGARRLHLEEVAPRTPPATVPALLLGCARGKAAIQVGGGIYTPQQARQLVGLGAQALVLRSALYRPGQLEKIVGAVGPLRLIIAPEVEEPRPEAAIQHAFDLGVRDLWLPSHPLWDRRLESLLAQGWTIWIGGGVTSLEAVLRYQATGVRGVVVGRALYGKALDLQQVQTALAAAAGGGR
jgi:phosphoribosylformimino-5-aminoimidazole carboxamide ribonucleotide (ProFAR) isomerase